MASPAFWQGSQHWLHFRSVSLRMGKPSRLFLGPDNLLGILEEEQTVAHSALMAVFCNMLPVLITCSTSLPWRALEECNGMEAAEHSFALSILPAYVKKQEYVSSVTQ